MATRPSGKDPSASAGGSPLVRIGVVASRPETPISVAAALYRAETFTADEVAELRAALEEPPETDATRRLVVLLRSLDLGTTDDDDAQRMSAA